MKKILFAAGRPDSTFKVYREVLHFECDIALDYSCRRL